MGKPSIMPIVMLLINVVLGSTGQILLKVGTTHLGRVREGQSLAVGLMESLKGIFTPYILLGFSAYAISAVIWVWILRQVNLSFAYPMISLSYVLVVLLSAFLLGEKIPAVTIVGLVLISAGVSLIGIGYGVGR